MFSFLMYVDDAFQRRQMVFMDQHCDIFENTEENKLIYMTIFEDYVCHSHRLCTYSHSFLQTKFVEKYIESYLRERIDGFSMDEFLPMLEYDLSCCSLYV